MSTINCLLWNKVIETITFFRVLQRIKQGSQLSSTNECFYCTRWLHHWSTRKQAPHRAITTPVPAPAQLCTTGGTSSCWKKTSARPRCVKGGTTTEMCLYIPKWQHQAEQWPCNQSSTVPSGKWMLHSWNTAAFHCAWHGSFTMKDCSGVRGNITGRC